MLIGKVPLLMISSFGLDVPLLWILCIAF